MQWRLFPTGTVPEHTTSAWYAGRDRAPHLEQPGHRERLLATSRLLAIAVNHHQIRTGDVPVVVDLGCGDGGLLQLVRDGLIRCAAWGYDLQPSNVSAGRAQRGVDVRFGDILDPSLVEGAQIVVLTEVLEHLIDPHAYLRLVAECGAAVVASSPAFETDLNAYEFHTWAFDTYGYENLFTQAGYTIQQHKVVSGAQLIWATQEPSTRVDVTIRMPGREESA